MESEPQKIIDGTLPKEVQIQRTERSEKLLAALIEAGVREGEGFMPNFNATFPVVGDSSRRPEEELGVEYISD